MTVIFAFQLSLCLAKCLQVFEEGVALHLFSASDD